VDVGNPIKTGSVMDNLMINFGVEILKIVPGRISIGIVSEPSTYRGCGGIVLGLINEITGAA
jgi:hypothetical protein